MTTYALPAPDDLGDSRHPAVGAWFFGPRAENFNHLETTFHTILREQRIGRQETYPDSDFITEDMKTTDLYREQIERLKINLSWVTRTLSNTSVPFWTPRYNAHMAMESSMPAVVGYLAGLLHNQNNVATEASALTTWLETQVGRGLCRMLGFNIQVENDQDRSKPIFIPGHPVPGPGIPTEPNDPYDDEPHDEADRPIGWGHITCGGSIANLESIWAARNLKFYPLSLKLSIEKKGSILGFLKDRFNIETSDGTKKLFCECTTWELLNLKVPTVLSIPTALYNEFGVSQNTLTKVLPEFSIQTTGKDFLEKTFGIEEPPQLFIATTKHYSWPKGAAIAGIGRGQVINVDVDDKARMDVNVLRKLLEESLAAKRAVYQVVCIIGSTEHGAVDPLVSVLKLRQEFQKKGLSFVVHCDGAWGGYFASCIREIDDLKNNPNTKTARADRSFVPTMALTPYTEKTLAWYGRADSITIDPHKSGYCPYPAGGLCYRDGRMRYLVTWTSPYIYRGEVESIGVYGVEGSKPGAAAVGAWLSHKIIGLDKKGYGTLLGEAIFTCAMLYCHWATMEPKEIEMNGVKARFTITPFTMLPAERDDGSEEDIKKQKQFIRERIIGKKNEEIYKDEEASALIAELGGDLQINAFAVNFEIDGKQNEDVVEANYLNNRIFNRTSITDWQDKQKPLKSVKLFLTSTIMAQGDYKGCLDTYKRRLGVKGSQDLYTLINVTMNPWATSSDFVQELADTFEEIANEELRYVVERNVETPTKHAFLIQGIEADRVAGVYLPMFNSQDHRWQMVISYKLPLGTLNEIRKRKEKDPKAFFILENLEADILKDFIKSGGSFEAGVYDGLPKSASPEPWQKCQVSDIEILYKRSLKQEYLNADYPEKMILYAYSAQRGTSNKPIFNVEHLLNVAVDIQLNSDTVGFQAQGIKQEDAEKLVVAEGVWFRLTDVHERVLQPLLQEPNEPKIDYQNPGLSWKAGAVFKFEALSAKDGPPKDSASVMFTGTLTLGASVYADANLINADVKVPVAHLQADAADNDGIYATTASFSLLGLQQSNASGLVAEYPNYLQMPELRLRNQANKMRLFKDSILSDAPEEVSYSPLGPSSGLRG